GDQEFKVEGADAAFHGHKTSCGAVLISSIVTSGRS
ncbi:PAAR domain-containing protein, partial [Streptomyces sp. NPDC005476]